LTIFPYFYHTNRLVAALLCSVEKYRNKQSCDRDVLGRLCAMLHTMGLYAQLERPLLSASAAFFLSEGRALVITSDAAGKAMLIKLKKIH
jgi:hypothetical protein